MDELPKVSYKPTSKRFAAIRYRQLQELKKKLWDIYITKELVLTYEEEPHQQVYVKGIKMIKIVDKDKEIYYCIDTSHDDYYEIGLPYVLECLIAEASKLEDFDEDKYEQTQEARRNNSFLDK